jgi:hypothetical protein
MTRRSVAGRRRAARANVDYTHYRVTYYDAAPWQPDKTIYMDRPSARAEQRRLEKALQEGVKRGQVESWEPVTRSRPNPYESAAELSEAFHGRPAESVSLIETPLHVHGTLTELGRLVSLELKDGTELEFDADVMLSSNEAGTHLFIDGGDQSVDLSMFPECDPTKEACSLGKAKYVTYWTAKFHLGKRDKTEGPYRHKFGEESGDMPSLEYDTVNRLLSLVGGHYHIDLDMQGGRYSAGIRD